MILPPLIPFMRVNITTILIVLLSLSLVVLSTCKSCSEKAYEKKIAAIEANCNPIPKIIHKIDTTYILVPQQAALAETLFKVSETKPTKRQIDSFIAYQIVDDTTNAVKWRNAYYELAESYNMEKNYEDTAIFLNGVAIVKTTVKQNEIQDQKTILDSIRRDVITVTKQVPYPQRKAGLYLGITAYGSKNGLLNGAGASLMYSSPRALNYEAGALFNSNSETSYFLSVKFPLTKK